MKDTFIRIFQQNITRPGSSDFLMWLVQSDFFTAPASTKYHSSFEGGLCRHSLNVFLRLSRIIDNEHGDPGKLSQTDMETIAICGLLHDVCKVSYYKVDYRNIKNDQGIWEKVPYYTVDDQIPYGHGEKSVYIISSFMQLSRDEAMAIRWHMGFTDEAAKGGSYTLSEAFKKHPLALQLHMADMQATYIDEEGSRDKDQQT